MKDKQTKQQRYSAKMREAGNVLVSVWVAKDKVEHLRVYSRKKLRAKIK